MNCAVYKGKLVYDHYLYVENENDFSRVPPELLTLLGDLQHVVNFELHPERNLAQADARAVISALDRDGYYLQLPPKEKLN